MAELNKINLLIVEDEALIAEDIKEICEDAGYGVRNVCYTPSQALNALDQTNFDLALLDINLEDKLTGIEIAQYIVHKKLFIPFIYLTSYFDTTTLEEARNTYPMGYVVKPFNKAQLISTIEISLYNYSKFKMPEGLVKEQIERKHGIHLTEREHEILSLICEGKTNEQIASKVFLSVNTIKFHIKNIYDKLKVGSRTQLLMALKR